MHRTRPVRLYCINAGPPSISVVRYATSQKESTRDSSKQHRTNPSKRRSLTMSEMFCVHAFPSAIHVEKFREKSYGWLRTYIERFHQRQCEGRQELCSHLPGHERHEPGARRMCGPESCSSAPAAMRPIPEGHMTSGSGEEGASGSAQDVYDQGLERQASRRARQ